MKGSLQIKEYSDYTNMTDDQIIKFAQKGDNLALEYLLIKYKKFVKAKARSYFLIGAERDDIIQEGMIGLYKAIRDYKIDKLASFRAFADLCITRQIITAIKTATRQKHQPLNSYISLNKSIFNNDSSRTLLDILQGEKLSDPEELLVTYESYKALRDNIKTNLSHLEMKVLMEYLKGKSYEEIADSLQRHVKSVDNALQRVKRKLNNYLKNNGI